MNTLFVSDLDGTLLRSDQRTSDYTNQVINTLAERGVYFSYATARSFHTARKVTKGMEARFPLIVYNGAFIVENGTGRILQAAYFQAEEAREILSTLLQQGVQPIVYSVKDGKEQMRYIRSKMHPEACAFMDTRKGDVRDTPVEDEGQLTQGDVFYFTCIEEAGKLKPLYEAFREKYRCVYARDIYSDAQWLEIMPKVASKANAIGRLKKILGCDKVVAFGDGLNDVDMFDMADEAYAVENAAPELKEKATAVIGGNNEDGVAQYLAKRLKMEEQDGQSSVD